MRRAAASLTMFTMKKTPAKSPMNRLARWALRTLALWAISKALELANEKLRERQRDRKLRARAAAAAALPRTLSHPADPSIH
jgi:hypothetical protein